MDIYEKLGKKIAFLRKQKENLNQELFGEMLGLSRTSIVNIEKGRQRLSIHKLLLISKVLEVEVSKLLEDVDINDYVPKSTISILQENHSSISKSAINFIISQEMKSKYGD